MSEELEVDNEIKKWLSFWGIKKELTIEKEAKEMVLQALTDKSTVNVYVDAEGVLIVESSGE